ncbi:hypothetical protein SAMN05660284_02379 [Formivibrio citricus]|uniref:SH3 domain-containing protein n=1 Tax=Formivibrio citricus TaxID=83765 RepID=A0A1I5CCX3_9NEIS|nr:hypothetical protein [Formivibrio citricus]SFN84776.1 hypothetical protein SAMN05660284_02379 [Formivibrio citricus]
MMHKLLPLLLFSSALALAEPGSVTRATDLKEKPFLDSATIARIAADSKVDIQSRQGAWAQVRTGEGKSGWLKVLNLRSMASSNGTGLGGVGQLLNVARTGSSGSTVTTGVKGLSAEQIKNARPSPQEVDRLKSYGVNAQEAQRFAKTSQLQPQKVAAIEVSASTSQPQKTSD